MTPSEHRHELHLRPLPPPAEALLRQHSAVPRLIAHLILVHDVAAQLLDRLSREQLAGAIDRQMVLFGAAVHDIGKVVCPSELTGAGNEHEHEGKLLLLQAGIEPRLARFAETHGSWRTAPDITIEDLLVALADTCWKGTRNPDLEQRITLHLSAGDAHDQWDVLLKVDDMVEAIAADADVRLAWQGRFAADIP